jgi:hypothetical protein
MPLRGRVGRHTQQGGRHCQNWQDDQQTVITLLNRIPAQDGGAGGSLNGNIAGRIVAGMASDALYRAISRFEDKHFPRRRSGFVDPGGVMLRRMEELAARAAKATANRPPPDPIMLPPQPPVRTSLDRLLDHVLLDAPWSHYPVSQRNAFARLQGLAMLYIEGLKTQGVNSLPYQVVLFGRAYITKGKMPTMARGDLEFITDKGRSERPPPMTESYGGPVDITADVTTGSSGVLLLYDNTICYRVFPYHTGRIAYLQDMNSGKSWTKAEPLKR